MSKQLIPDDRYQDGGKAYTQEELESPCIKCPECNTYYCLETCPRRNDWRFSEDHASKMERFQREADAYAHEDKIGRMVEE